MGHVCVSIYFSNIVVVIPNRTCSNPACHHWDVFDYVITNRPRLPVKKYIPTNGMTIDFHATHCATKCTTKYGSVVVDNLLLAWTATHSDFADIFLLPFLFSILVPSGFLHVMNTNGLVEFMRGAYDNKNTKQDDSTQTSNPKVDDEFHTIQDGSM